jgi:hypothetical protein
MLRTNAPWDTMPHLSWLECDPPPGRRRRVASIWQREVQIQADGRAEWRAETMQIVCDFSAADGFRRDGHIDNRRARGATADAPETQIEAARGCPR